jgi:hypothetical protein
MGDPNEARFATGARPFSGRPEGGVAFVIGANAALRPPLKNCIFASKRSELRHLDALPFSSRLNFGIGHG